MPGSPKASPLEMCRDHQRLAGLHGDAVEERLAAGARQGSLDQVELAGRDAAAEQQHVVREPGRDARGELFRVVARDAERDRRHAERGEDGEQEVGVRVAQLARSRRRLGRDDLVAGGEHGHPRRPVHRDPLVALRGEQRESAGAERRPGGEQGRAAAADLAAAADRLAGGDLAVEAHPLASAVGPLDRRHAVGLRRHRAAGHDAQARAARQGRPGASPAAIRPATGSSSPGATGPVKT